MQRMSPSSQPSGLQPPASSLSCEPACPSLSRGVAISPIKISPRIHKITYWIGVS